MRRSIQLAGGVSVHVIFGMLLALVLVAPRLERATDGIEEPLIWTAPQPGATRGGGTGGNNVQPSPAPLHRLLTQDVPRFVVPRMPDVLAPVELPGVQVAFAAPNATGPGTDVGPAGGEGDGKGGPGSGSREGSGVGSGDGPFLDGSPGVSSPQVIWEKRPDYTQEAIRARAQGTVLLEAVVRDDGSVGAVRVVRSMNPSFGLDAKAVEAASLWRFRPGTYQGRPVAVRVFVELVFTLR